MNIGQLISVMMNRARRPTDTTAALALEQTADSAVLTVDTAAAVKPLPVPVLFLPPPVGEAEAALVGSVSWASLPVSEAGGSAGFC